MRKNIVKRVCAVCLAFVALAVIPFGGSYAKDLSSLKDEKKALEQKIAETDEKVAALRNDSAKQMELVAALRQQTEALQEKIDALNESINTLQSEIDELNVQIDKNQADFDEKYDAYKQRLRALYMSGSTSNLEIILSAGDMSDLLTRAELVSSISKQDQEALNKLNAILDEIRANEKQLIDNKAVLDADKADLEEEQAQLTTSMDEMNAHIAELEAQANAYTESAEYQESEEELKELEEEIRRLSSNVSGGIMGTGQMTYPCPGYSYVSASYPTYPSGGYHGGIDFAAPYGTSIVAADSGTVIATNYWDYSFGYHIIISHGNGITTLYGHTSQILVRNGQNVQKGQVIARVGSTGNSTGNHVHFEVRKNGVRENPWGYL